MKRILLISVISILFFKLNAQSQYDSIYTSNEGVIAATIKEITNDAVKFAYPNEDLINSMTKTRIIKIVFKSGRTQEFSEATSYKKVTGVQDWQNVSVSKLESEIQGLYKLGDVSVKAKNTSGFASSSKINDRAFEKLKMETALKGGNIVFIVSETSVGNKMGNAFQAAQAAETQISGIAYTNQLPKYTNLITLLKDKRTVLSQKDELGNNSMSYSTDRVQNVNTPINNVQERDGFIYVICSISGAKATEFRVTYFDQTKIILMTEDKGKVTNYTLNIL